MIGLLKRRVTAWRTQRAGRLEYLRLADAGLRAVKISFPERIGHLCLETDCLLKDTLMNGGNLDRLSLLLTDEKLANAHIVKYFGTRLTVLNGGAISEYMRISGDPAGVVLETNRYAVAMYETADAYSVYARWGDRPPLFKLTDEDQEALACFLREKGVAESEWFACLHAREGGYSPGDEWVHRYRSVNIAAFSSAASAIIERGGWVVRVGDPTMRPFAPHPRVIDYALDARKSPRLDVALSAGCKFFLGTASGLFNVAEIFGRPCVIVNMAPLGGAYAFAPADISIPQRLRHKNGDFLPFRNVMAEPCSSYRLNDEFEDAGLQNVPNSPDEICEATCEMMDRLDGDAVYTDDDRRRQREFRSLLRPGHYSYGAASDIGRDFLRRYF